MRRNYCIKNKYYNKKFKNNPFFTGYIDNYSKYKERDVIEWVIRWWFSSN